MTRPLLLRLLWVQSTQTNSPVLNCLDCCAHAASSFPWPFFEVSRYACEFAELGGRIFCGLQERACGYPKVDSYALPHLYGNSQSSVADKAARQGSVHHNASGKTLRWCDTLTLQCYNSPARTFRARGTDEPCSGSLRQLAKNRADPCTSY